MQNSKDEAKKDSIESVEHLPVSELLNESDMALGDKKDPMERTGNTDWSGPLKNVCDAGLTELCQDETTLLQKTNTNKSELIEKLRKEINEMQVRHNEELYWIRLELNSSRLEKEFTEDRLAELYRELQEIVEAKRSVGETLTERKAGTGVCIDVEYVLQIESGLVKFERTIDLLNRQMAMMKTSSDAVIASLKQELTDLMEEKSRIEIDLLNQISVLDEAKKRIEIRLDESAIKDRKMFDSNKVYSREDRSFPSTRTAEAANHDNSFLSTATTQNSSINPYSQVLPSHGFLEGTDDWVASCSKENQALRAEVTTLKADNKKLNQDVNDLTEELLYTQTSANTALSVSELNSDKEETVAYLERVSSLSSKTDQSIQVAEAILQEVQSKVVLQSGNDIPNTDETEIIMSTLEKAVLVYGQVKMSLMSIELSFCNNVSRIEHDSRQHHEHPIDHHKPLLCELRKIRAETFASITTVEQEWAQHFNQLEQRMVSETQSLQQTLHLQLEALKKSQTEYRSLEKEVGELKRQLGGKLVTNESREDKETTGKTSQEDADHGDSAGTVKARNGGLVVSHSVMIRLQKEVLSVVEQIKEKNETIVRLNETVSKYKKREEVLKKELKRVRLNSDEKATELNVTNSLWKQSWEIQP